MGTAMATELDREIAAYESMQAELENKHMGEWVLIFDEKLIGTFPSLDAAAEVAVGRFGRGPYLIRQVGAPPIVLPVSVVSSYRHA